MGAQEAERRGLVNRVAPAGQAVTVARELAEEIIAASPTSVRITLELMDATAGIADTVAAVTHRSPGLDEIMTTEDATEGLTAFAAKRPPQWVNR